MSDDDLLKLRARSGIAPWRLRLAEFIESGPVQRFILAAIIVNAVVLGLYIDPTILPQLDPLWRAIDLFCLGVFAVEIVIKLVAYRLGFFKSGWNVFDFLVVAIALIPGNGALSVLRTLRVLRVLRLLTVVPSLRRVVAAFIHSIPGLGAVVMVMAIFFYAAAVMAVGFFGATFPDWFGSIGKSLYTLFQVLTLESWSMGDRASRHGGASLRLGLFCALHHHRDLHDSKSLHRHHRLDDAGAGDDPRSGKSEPGDDRDP